MSAQSNIKYAIIAGGIVFTIVTGVTAIGTPLNDTPTFTSVARGVKMTAASASGVRYCG
jgi:Flp pilus assembly pilin Flp